jgi:hypothetical protein
MLVLVLLLVLLLALVLSMIKTADVACIKEA